MTTGQIAICVIGALMFFALVIGGVLLGEIVTGEQAKACIEQGMQWNRRAGCQR